MTIQERETIELDSPRVSSDEITSQLSIKGMLNDQLTGDDSVPKTRKPYTITKQRERWTEEEHTKFLEALKLYGRAWRKIEEHVGTKTAIQIRSHAQKFFTKVVRESSTGDSSSEKPIEIPPPRPKRKPMHPYPRKQQVSLVTKGISIPEKITFSSLDLSVSELENQSPTSVLSAAGSETCSDEDLSGHNGSPSNANNDIVMDSQTTNVSAEYELSSSAEISTPNNGLLHEKGPTPSFLKLFGKTLLVKDSQESYNMVIGSCEAESLKKSDKTCLIPPMVQFPVTNFECTRELFQNGNFSANNSCYGPLPWLTLSVPTIQVHIPTLVKARPLYEQSEGFSSGSNSVDCLFGRKEKAAEMSFSSCKLDSRVSVNSVDCRKGFVPYKRCLSDRDSSEETVELQQKRRIHLCL